MHNEVKEVVDIDALDLNDTWKRRFEIYTRLKADKLSRDETMKSETYKQLSRKERRLISFNFWAFMGGFIYYYIKGMHHKASVILAFSLLWGASLILIEFFSGHSIPDSIYWVVPGATCSYFAGWDYYRKVITGEKIWRGWPQWFHRRSGAILTPFAALFIHVLCVYFIVTHQLATEQAQQIDNPVRLECGLYRLDVTQEELTENGEDALCEMLSLL